MSSRVDRKNKRKNVERLLLLGVAGVLLLTVGAFLWGSSVGSDGPIARIFSSASGKINILVLGVDERPDDVGRSDTMFVVSVNTKKQDIDVISIPRDTRVKIPGYRFDKINHAYAEGKYKLSQRTVEQFLGVSIQHYLIIDFNGFKRIIDALDGITIDVEKRMYYEDPYDDLVINLYPGEQTLNGENAIGYVRYRDQDGDIGRIARQQKFMKAVLQKVAQPGSIARLPALIRELSGAVRTSMSTGEMVNIANTVNEGRKQGLRGHMIPGTPANIAEISYWIPDIVETRKMVAGIMDTTLDERALAVAQQLAAEYEQSIPPEMVVVKPSKAEDSTKKPNDKDAQKGKQPVTKPETVKPETKPLRFRAEIINASGMDEAGAKVSSELKKQGFEVVAVTQAAKQERTTTVIEHSGNDAVIKKVSSLPFEYNLSLLKDGVKNAEVTVIVGKNYK